MALIALAPASASADYRGAVLADAPGGYWRLGEAPGTTSAADATGNANNGTYVNDVTLGQPGALAGDPDTAARFDGTNDTVSIPHNATISPAGTRSVEAWVKPASLSTTMVFLRKHGQYQLRTTSSGTVYFHVWKGGSSLYAKTPSGAVAVGRWNHLVGTWDGSTMRVYVDGVLKGSATLSAPADSGTLPLYLGSAKGGEYRYNGTLDEVAVYPRALSAAQVAAHFAAGRDGSSTPPPADTTAPTVTLTSPPATTSDSTPAFAGKGGIATGDQSTVTIKVHAGTTLVATLTATRNATTGDYSVSPTTALADGTYTAQAFQSDAAGNTGTSAVRTFTVDTTVPADTTPPTVTLSAPAAGTTSDATPTYAGAAGTASGDLTTVTVRVYGGSTPTGTPVQTLSATVNSGIWTVTPSVALADGTFTAQAEQLDAANNVGLSNARTFTVQAGTLPPPPPSGNLVGLWHMDETSGSTMVDSSGKGNHGTISGAVLGRPGAFNLAYEFNSRSIVKSNSSLNPGSNDFTVSMWIKFPNGPSTDSMDVIRKGFSGTSGGDFKVEIYPNDTLRCYFKDGQGDSVEIFSTQTLADDNWHHIQCRRRGTTFEVVTDANVRSKSASAVGSISNGASLNIGAKNENEDHFLGLMDEVAMTIG